MEISLRLRSKKFFKHTTIINSHSKLNKNCWSPVIILTYLGSNKLQLYLNASSWCVRSFLWASILFGHTGCVPTRSNSREFRLCVMEMVRPLEEALDLPRDCSWVSSSSNWFINSLTPGKGALDLEGEDEVSKIRRRGLLLQLLKALIITCNQYHDHRL